MMASLNKAILVLHDSRRCEGGDAPVLPVWEVSVIPYSIWKSWEWWWVQKVYKQQICCLGAFPSNWQNSNLALTQDIRCAENLGISSQNASSGKGLKSLRSKLFNFLSVLSRYCHGSMTFLCYFSWQVISGQLKKHSHSWDEVGTFSQGSLIPLYG